MPRFSANISMLFAEHDLLERPRLARRAGFGAFEVQFPYDIPAEVWRDVKHRAGLPIALFNLPAGDLVDGGQGLAGVPGREDAFREALDLAAAYAKLLKPRAVNVLAGTPRGERVRCLEIFAANLHRAAQVMEELGVGVVVEAINDRDRPGFLVSTIEEAVAAIDRAGHPNLAVQADLYHMQIMEGDLTRTLEHRLDRIGHIQFADVPARNEPGTGEINFPFVFAALDRIGYDGWVGAEYRPSGPTETTLGWLAPYRGGGAHSIGSENA